MEDETMKELRATDLRISKIAESVESIKTSLGFFMNILNEVKDNQKHLEELMREELKALHSRMNTVEQEQIRLSTVIKYAATTAAIVAGITAKGVMILLK
jgi:transcription termination factor NusB